MYSGLTLWRKLKLPQKHGLRAIHRIAARFVLPWIEGKANFRFLVLVRLGHTCSTIIGPHPGPGEFGDSLPAHPLR